MTKSPIMRFIFLTAVGSLLFASGCVLAYKVGQAQAHDGITAACKIYGGFGGYDDRDYFCFPVENQSITRGKYL